jgi:site-specific DNA-cytosine methylase
MKIRTFELCAGYDSQLMALERLKKKYSDFDYECIGWSEIEPSAIALHNACFPSLSGKNFGDMTKIDWSKVADFDLLTYSTPCQSVSQAGKQKGIEEGSNTRSSILWFTRNAIITKRPKYLLMENVEALVQTKFIGFFNKWRKELESYGYVNYAKVVNAADCGVPQNRKRVFMLCSEGKWIKGEIHSPKVELGKNIANTITSASKDSLVVLGETRLRIRRLTPRELFRLMNVDEEYIDKMLESGVSKSSLQKAAGNSIVVACMERIFKELWFSESNVKVADDGQLCLF